MTTLLCCCGWCSCCCRVLSSPVYTRRNGAPVLQSCALLSSGGGPLIIQGISSNVVAVLTPKGCAHDIRSHVTTHTVRGVGVAQTKQCVPTASWMTPHAKPPPQRCHGTARARADHPSKWPVEHSPIQESICMRVHIGILSRLQATMIPALNVGAASGAQKRMLTRSSPSSSRPRSICADPTFNTAFEHMVWQSPNDPVALSFIRTFAPHIGAASVARDPSFFYAPRTFMNFNACSPEGHDHIIKLEHIVRHQLSESGLRYVLSKLTLNFFTSHMWPPRPHRIVGIQIIQAADTSVTSNDLTTGSSEDHPIPESHIKMVESGSGQAVDNLDLIQIRLPSFIPSAVPAAGIASSDKDWWIQILTRSVHYTEEDLDRIRQIAPGFVNVALERLKFSAWQPQLLTQYDKEQ